MSTQRHDGHGESTRPPPASPEFKGGPVKRSPQSAGAPEGASGQSHGERRDAAGTSDAPDGTDASGAVSKGTDADTEAATVDMDGGGDEAVLETEDAPPDRNRFLEDDKDNEEDEEEYRPPSLWDLALSPPEIFRRSAGGADDSACDADASKSPSDEDDDDGKAENGDDGELEVFERVEDWDDFTDPNDALAWVVNYRSPPECPHGMLVQDPPVMFSWGWYWFATPAERLAFVKNLEPRLHEADEEEAERIRAEYDESIGTSPDEREHLGIEFNGGTIAWVGTIRDLTHGTSYTARKCRGDFWVSWGKWEGEPFFDDEEEVVEDVVDDPNREIPEVPDDQLVQFLWSLWE